MQVIHRIHDLHDLHDILSIASGAVNVAAAHSNTVI